MLFIPDGTRLVIVPVTQDQLDKQLYVYNWALIQELLDNLAARLLAKREKKDIPAEYLYGFTPDQIIRKLRYTLRVLGASNVEDELRKRLVDRAAVKIRLYLMIGVLTLEEIATRDTPL